MNRPRPLAPGDRLHVIAPSSPFDRARFDAGLALLRARYRVSLAAGLFERTGFLAGDDEQRRASIEAALAEPDVAAIVAARGGYGATRLLPGLPLEPVRAAARWLVGFSDVTALHALWARAGVCSIHGPMVASLVDASEDVRSRWFALLEGASPAPLRGLQPVVHGRARGWLFGGNLTVLTALVGTPHLPALDGAILLLEDVAERPYRLDRMLTTLLNSGALTGVQGVLLGQFSQCEPGPDGVSAHDVLCERLRVLGVPVLADAPVGHVPDNYPVLLGADVELDADACQLTWQ